MSKQVQAAVRIVGTRDSATSILRKLGIKPRDYNFFITKRTDPEGDSDFEVAVEAATAHLQSLLLPTTPITPVPKPEPRQPTPKASQPKGRSCSDVARELIIAGRPNAEVWAVLVAEFNLDAKKRGYPAWYRFQLRRLGHNV